jgi:5-aminolevulinate synthase
MSSNAKTVIGNVSKSLLGSPSTGKCPFLRSYSSKSMEKAGITLSEALKACPFMKSQNNSSHQIKLKRSLSNTHSPPSNLNIQPLRCPYTTGGVTPSSICPITNIDVSRRTHSPVLQHIGLKVQETSCPNAGLVDSLVEEAETIPNSWKSVMSDKIQSKKEDGTYRKFTKINKDAQHAPYGEEIPQQGHVLYPKTMEYYCSNDYLNMSVNPKVISTAKRAAECHGVGAGGTRNISGNSELTHELEREIAHWHQKPDALLFNGCYAANDATLSMLMGKTFDAQCFSDSGNHASMIQGILRGRNEHRDRSNRLIVFEHNNLEELEEKLFIEVRKNPTRRRIVAFESVHSMNGGIQSVSEICDLAHKYGAITFCDEVHAIGLYGRTGAGIGELDEIQDKIDIVSGTLGKGVGGFGGYIAASEVTIDFIRQYAPGFIFTTALPPNVIAPNIASINILKDIEGHILREKHFEAVNLLRKHLDLYRIEYSRPKRASHVTTVKMGSAEMADYVMAQMSKRGYYVQAIKHPTVGYGDEMLRLTVSPKHLTYPGMIPRFVRNLSGVMKSGVMNIK